MAKIICGGAALAAVASCGGEQAPEMTESGLKFADFEASYPGVVYNEETGAYSQADSVEAKPVALYRLVNDNGMEVCITNFGGRIVSIMVPDKDGNKQDVVLGFDNIEDYFPWNNTSDLGSSVGRYANRLNQGIVDFDGEKIQLPKNNFGHCLHGGFTGWQYQVYEVKEATPTKLVMEINSPDGDNSFPGNVVAQVTFELDNENGLSISYDGTTDKLTVLNMTNHSYFNLNGDQSHPVTNHYLTVNADNMTPVDDTYMTTGDIVPVEGTLFDFREPKQVGADINEDNLKNDVQLHNGNGYDHNWVLNTKGDQNTSCARVYSEVTGIVLDVYTNEPGLQVYTGNFLDGTMTGKKGIKMAQRCGICLESQKYPDSPNKVGVAGWENSNAYLKPGEKYHSFCKFAFSVQK